MIVSEAAQQLGMSTQTLRLALQQELFPFGVAVRTSESRYTYYINPAMLQRYVEGTLYEKDVTSGIADSSNVG
jgi:hypothetical protein